MISRASRLTKSQVTAVKTAGQTLKSNHFTLVYTKSHDQAAHFGVIVSKKISPKAVTRNLLRRRFYTAAQGFTKSSLSILIIPHQHILKHSAEVTGADLIRQLELLCSKP